MDNKLIELSRINPSELSEQQKKEIFDRTNALLQKIDRDTQHIVSDRHAIDKTISRLEALVRLREKLDKESLKLIFSMQAMIDKEGSSEQIKKEAENIEKQSKKIKSDKAKVDSHIFSLSQQVHQRIPSLIKNYEEYLPSLQSYIFVNDLLKQHMEKSRKRMDIKKGAYGREDLEAQIDYLSEKIKLLESEREKNMKVLGLLIDFTADGGKRLF